MELEEMKNLWQKYDKTMKENNVLTERLIKEMMHSKSGRPLKSMLNTEYAGAITCILLLVVFLPMAGRAFSSMAALLAYVVLIIAIAISLGLSVYKIRQLSDIDMGDSTITDVTYRIQRFRLLISKERLIGTCLLPLIILCAYIFVDQKSYTELVNYLPRLIIGCVAGVAVSLMLYKRLYFNNIKQITQTLEEVNSLKSGA